MPPVAQNGGSGAAPEKEKRRNVHSKRQRTASRRSGRPHNACAPTKSVNRYGEQRQRHPASLEPGGASVCDLTVAAFPDAPH
jgi:hypothetical protein